MTERIFVALFFAYLAALVITPFVAVAYSCLRSER